MLNTKFIKYCILAVLILTSDLSLAQLDTIILDGKWIFRQEKSHIWHTAQVPGNVFTDLESDSIIKKVFWGKNEAKYHWVETKNWIYKKTFSISENFLRHSHITLVLNGLDTYAKVFVNGHATIFANNMFLRWLIPVKKLLHAGENVIEIKFYSPDKIIDSLQKQFFVPLPQKRGFIRKAPYQFGWDWAGRFVTMGIWKKIFLIGWDNALITNFFIVTDSIRHETAYATAYVSGFFTPDQTFRLKINDCKSKKTYVDTLISPLRTTYKKAFEFHFSIPQVKLWWPHGYGQQNLYCFKLILSFDHSKVERRLITGFRQVKLVTKPDRNGKSFYFKINGRRVFVKGANLVPMSQFPSQVSYTRERQLLQTAVKSNINLLRVWGGGIYQSDRFYSLCDSLGIMLWQEFMFACDFYPVTKNFTSNVRAEAQYQISRLASHPSIIIWCGSNEVYEAWFNWGYQHLLKYSAQDSVRLLKMQYRLFDTILPQELRSLDIRLPYIPSSPQTGWGHAQAYKQGDVHFWGVWWAKWPFETYDKYTGRFMSEYGFQSFPSIKTILSIVDTQNLFLDDSLLLNHQKHPFGMQNIQNYMLRYLGLPKGYFFLYKNLKNVPKPSAPAQAKDIFSFKLKKLSVSLIRLFKKNISTEKRLKYFRNYIFYSQLLQAYGISRAIEDHRRAKPYCMGTIYWQFNDSWPAISWSSTDYYNNTKVLQYAIKRLYSKILLSGIKHGSVWSLYAVNDSLNKIEGFLQIKIYNLNGKIIKRYVTKIEIGADTSQKIFSLNLSNLDTNNIAINAAIISHKRLVTSRLFFLAYPKYLKLRNAKVRVQIKKINHKYLIRIKTNKPIFCIYLWTDIPGKFSDNFFSMLPGGIYTVYFMSKRKTQSLRLNYTIYKKF